MTSLTTVPTEVPRDRWGRPMIVPPDGGKPVAYTRCTTFVDAIDDKYQLQLWMQRMVAIGLSGRPDLRHAVAAHLDDKRELNKVCEQAKEAAAASGKATIGTAVHKLAERIDRGEELPTLEADIAADLEAYRAATVDLKPVLIEEFCVLDTLQIGGTPDRVVEYDGKRYIADLKTGSVHYSTLKIAAQMAVYARSYLYDQATGERAMHGAETTRGLIIHVPAGEATATPYWVDLEAGWHAVQVARDVREKRRIKFADLTEPFEGKPARPSLHAQKKAEEREAVVAEGVRDRIARMIRTCTTAEEVRGVWASCEADWDDGLTDLAREHIAGLGRAS